MPEAHKRHRRASLSALALFLAAAVVIAAPASADLLNPHGSPPTVQEFPAPDVVALAGTSSALWYATPTQATRLDSSGHTLGSWILPKGVSIDANQPGEPFPIGRGGGMWFTGTRGTGHHARRVIGFISTTGRVKLHVLPRGHAGTVLTRDSRGRIWFQDTYLHHGKTVATIGELTRSGRVKEFRVPGRHPALRAVTATANGQVWFTSCGAGANSNYVGRLDRHGHARRWLVSGPYCAGDIVEGPDANMWFTDRLTELGPLHDKVGRVTPSGAITYYELAGTPEQPEGIVSGPDGALWVTDHDGPDLARVTVGGQISYTSLARSSEPTQIVRGPSSTMWFIDEQTGGFTSNPDARIGVIK